SIPIRGVLKELKFVPFLVSELMKLNEIETSTNEMMLEELFQGVQFYASEYKDFLSDDNNEK
ncbi:hypothetical protein MKX03_023503, partial [Papaver bracteatum]